MNNITNFQETCYSYRIVTSFSILTLTNITPERSKTEKMAIRFWVDNGKNFSFDTVEQSRFDKDYYCKHSRLIILDPKDRSTTYRSENIRILHEKLRCIFEGIGGLDKKLQKCALDKPRDLSSNEEMQEYASKSIHLQECVSKIVPCLEEQELPITEEMVLEILGNTIMLPSENQQQAI